MAAEFATLQNMNVKPVQKRISNLHGKIGTLSIKNSAKFAAERSCNPYKIYTMPSNM